MRVLRWIMTAAIVFGTLELLAYWCYGRWECNSMKRSIENRILAVVQSSEAGSERSMRVARNNLDAIAPCRERYPWDIDFRMELGASLMILQRYDDAAGEYQAALQYAQRPEIYLNLGRAQLKADRREDAIRSFLTAIRFNPTMVTHEDMLYLQDEVVRRRAEQAK